jgi:hypothetical protein
MSYPAIYPASRCEVQLRFRATRTYFDQERRSGKPPALDSDIPRLQVHTHNSSNGLPNSPSYTIQWHQWKRLVIFPYVEHDLRFESYSQLSCDKGQAFHFIRCLQLFAHFYSPLKFDHNITQNLVLHCWHWTVRLQWMHSSGLQTIMNSSWNLCLGCNIPSSGNALSL